MLPVLPKYALCVFFSAISICSFSQENNPLINSGEVLKEASKFYYDDKFKDAANCYLKINKSDTNYSIALHDLANTYSSDSQFIKAIEISQQGLKLFPERYSAFTMQLGNANDNIGKVKEAQQFYDSAIKRNPHNSLLLFNKGITNFKIEDFETAKLNFQQSLIVNPYYTSSHYFLGRVYLNEGNLVPAMMAFSTYLLIAPGGTHHTSAIELLNNISKGTDDIIALVKKRKPGSEKSYNEAQEILLSKIAFDPKYKSVIDVNDYLIKQLQVVFEKLEYKADDKSFAMQFYVPFYANSLNEKYFEPLIYTMFSGVDLKFIQTWNKKNKKSLDFLVTKAVGYFNLIRETRKLNLKDRDSEKIRYAFNNNELIAQGEYQSVKKDLLPVGKWKFFNDEGGVILEGTFNENGKKQGIWKSFYNSGNIKEKFTYDDGEANGKQEGWFDNGNKWYEESYQKGNLDGVQLINYLNENKKTVFNFKAGKKEGDQKYYNSSGILTHNYNYKNDKLEGAYKSFYANGSVKDESSFTNDVENGNYKSYYESGKVFATGKIVNGKRDGLWENYHENGKLSAKTTYVAGEVTGEFSEYYENGVISTLGNYTRKKLDGKSLNYDTDGIVFVESLYDNGRLREIKFLDKKGNVIANTTTRKGAATITFYSADGVKTSEGSFDKDGMKQGKFIEFYSSGKVSGESEWKDGERHGRSVSFLADGTLSMETTYKNGIENGYAKYYYSNKKLKSEGWIVDGDRQQSWIFYNCVGDITSKEYFLNGELNGYSQYYYPGNILDYEYKYKHGWIEEIIQYDTTGKVLQVNTFPKGEGKMIFRHLNGKLLSENNYKHYMLNGVKQYYYSDGTLSGKLTFVNDLKEGVYNKFSKTGKLTVEGSYLNNDQTGTWKYYYDNGQLSLESHFEKGEITGTSTSYRKDGSLDYTAEYKDGDLHGKSSFYGDGKKLMYILNFEDGTIKSYQFMGKDGKLTDPVKLLHYSGKVHTFYENGSPSATFEFFENNRNSTYKYYYSTGKVWMEGTMNNGSFEGTQKTYHPSGTLAQESFYIAGNLHGKRSTFYADGKPEKEENYYNDDIHGINKYYDSKGKATSETYYYGYKLTQ